jgi:hypothetical protein
MQITDATASFGNSLTFKFKDQTQYPMRRWVLRAHVYNNAFVFAFGRAKY